MIPPQPGQSLKSYSGPDVSSSQSYSATYDYSGLDDHIKRQDALSQLTGSKFASLYGGDVAQSVEAANRIRSLLQSLKRHAPGTTERNPNQLISPLKRVASESTSQSASSRGSSFELENPGKPNGPMYEDSMSGDPEKRRKIP